MQKMDEIFHSVSDSVIHVEGQWQLKYKDRFFFVFTDEGYNRMRIITPVTDVELLDKNLMRKSLEANFHSALDVKYAISDDVLWSIFVHPMRELTDNQLINALGQVYQAAETYGASFSSTGLFFPENKRNPEKDNPTKQN
jgi:hypothetical protein